MDASLREELDALRQENAELRQKLAQGEENRAAEGLIESERYLKVAATVISGVLWTADADGALTYYSQQRTDSPGDSGGSTLGWGWTRLIHPDDLDACLRLWRASVATGERFEITCRSRRQSDGSYQQSVAKAAPVKDAAGRVQRWLGSFTPVSETQETRRELREAHEKLRALIRFSPLPIVAFDPSGAITLWNPAAEALFGWSESEVLGKPIPFVPQEKREEHLAMRERDLSGQTFHNRLIRRKRKDGTPIDLSVSTAALRDPHGELTGIMSLYMDVTEQRRMQEALYLSDVRFRVALNEAPVSVFNQDRDLRYTWSHSNSPLFSPEALVGKTDAELISWPEIERLIGVKQQILETGVGIQTEICVPEQGSQAHYQMTLEPLRDEIGAIAGITGAAVNVTEQKRIEQDLREANRALTRANEDLHQFAYSASHDLQEPLRVISVYCQMLDLRSRDILDEDGKEFLAYIVEAANRMQLLVRDLLAYTKLASLGPVGDLPVVDSNAALRAALASLRASVEECGAAIICEELPPVRIHPTHLQQLLQNLIGNAVKYRGQAAPEVRVQGRREGEECIITVQDNGIGINPMHYQKIFGLFKRLHSTEYPGTGIGLAICQRIVARYGGRIWVESEPGRGSTFSFAVPAGESL